jgi:hypothetical protein
VFILKTLKVIYFHMLLQVFILKVLRACTKIVQILFVPTYGEQKTSLKKQAQNAKTPAEGAGATGSGAILPKEYGTRGATFCQAKSEKKFWPAYQRK